MIPIEQEIHDGRRAFPTAQQLLTGSPVEPASASIRSIGWHGSDVHPETGAFAVVGDGFGLDELIGEVVRVTYRGRMVFAYVLGSRAVPVELSLTRRTFSAVTILARESIPAVVEVVDTGG